MGKDIEKRPELPGIEVEVPSLMGIDKDDAIVLQGEIGRAIADRARESGQSDMPTVSINTQTGVITVTTVVPLDSSTLEEIIGQCIL